MIYMIISAISSRVIEFFLDGVIKLMSIALGGEFERVGGVPTTSEEVVVIPPYYIRRRGRNEFRRL